MGNVWARRYAVVVAACTLLLVIAGGLVTSNDAALSVPDWPLSYGKLVPPLEGGIRFEFAHRALAALVGLLVIGLAVWTRRKLAWLAVAAVVAQALLGGAAVRLATPKLLVISHACLAQLCFGLVVAVLVGQVSGLPGRLAWQPAVATSALFAQTILGAAVRHGVATVAAHIVGAGVATILAMWAGLQILSRHMDQPPARRAAMLLLSFTVSQVFLGMGAYMSRIVTADAPQPMPIMIWFTVAHVAMGSLAFGAGVALTMMAPEEAHGEMAVA